jgi:hypothetical protein
MKRTTLRTKYAKAVPKIILSSDSELIRSGSAILRASATSSSVQKSDYSPYEQYLDETRTQDR